MNSLKYDYKKFISYYFFNLSSTFIMFKKFLILVENTISNQGKILLVTQGTFDKQEVFKLSKHFLILDQWPEGLVTNFSRKKKMNFLYNSLTNVKKRQVRNKINFFFKKHSVLTNMTGLPSLVVCFSSQKNTFLFKELQLAGIPVVVITDNFNIDSGSSYLIRCNYKAIFFKSFFIKMIINSAQLGRKKLFISKKSSLRNPYAKVI